MQDATHEGIPYQQKMERLQAAWLAKCLVHDLSIRPAEAGLEVGRECGDSLGFSWILWTHWEPLGLA